MTNGESTTSEILSAARTVKFVMRDAFGGKMEEKEAFHKTATDPSIIKANLDFLSGGVDEVFDLFCAVRDEFDGSEYMQGKKDGLRLALSFLGKPEMADFNRGGKKARERSD